MSALVQATCPGCKRTLRVPADWLQQRIRCKHCGMILNARPNGSAGTSAPAPRPVPRPAPATPQKAKPAAKAPPAAPPERRRAAPPEPAPARAPAPPPQQVTHIPSVSPASPFDDLDDGDVEQPVRRRRRNPNANIALAVALVLLVLIGTSVTVIVVKFGGRLNVPPADNREERDVGKVAAAKDRDPNEPAPAEVFDKSVLFPRRALLISVHNYLFANPVGAGMPMQGSRNVAGLPDKLCNGLRIPHNQIAHLSDAAPRGQARPPLRKVIEKTLTDFLTSSRPQDRVMVFFIGHAAEAGDEAFLVPMEGELDRPETLIPLKWVYGELAKCPARQKVLVLDVCRFNPVQGVERPGGEPMGPKLAKAIQAPPAGVQVWSACGESQQSYETDQDAMGVFLDEFQATLELVSEGRLKLQDRIQSPRDALPVEKLKQEVDTRVTKELKPLKLTQTTHLSGTPGEGGADFDPAVPPPPAPTLADAPPPLPQKMLVELRKLFADAVTPPIKPSTHETGINFSLLPHFDEKKIESYLTESGKETDLQKTVRKTQALLFAVSGYTPPDHLTKLVREEQKTLRANLTILRDGYRAPGNENAFKNQIRNDEQEVARIMRRLEMAREDMQNVADQREAEPKRWQASYDFMLARLEAEIAYLYEYQSMLGQMRKELPPRDRELYGGWKLAATTSLSGDSAGKKLAAASRKALEKLAKEHAGTPWEVLAKRAKLTALGLEWKPAR